MAIDTTQFQGFSYIKSNGVDKYLVEEYLLPGLAVQSRLGKGSRGIPLPTPFGKTQEFIRLEDAGELLLSWLEDNNNLYTKDKAKLLKLLRGSAYEQFANIAHEIYSDRIKDPNKLFTVARQQNLANYRASQANQTITSTSTKYDPGKAIDDYNKLYSQLLRAANIGTSPALFSKILPIGIPSGRGDLSKQVLAQIIMQNLSELRGAAHAYVGDDEKATLAVSHKLGQIIAISYPEQTAYLNVLGDKEISQNLYKFTENVENQLNQDGIKIETVDQIKNRALAAVDDTVITEYEIYQQIQKILPLTSDAEKKQFAKALVQSINASAGKILTSDQIIDLAGQRSKADTAQLEIIKAEIQKSGLDFAIEYRQEELNILVNSNHLTLGERNLLRRGINPFATHKSEVDLKIDKEKFQNQYTKDKVELEEKYRGKEDSAEYKQILENLEISWARRFREQENHLGLYSLLEFEEKNLINRTRFGRFITDSRSRIFELQGKFFDKWIDIEETITGKKFLNNLYNNWDLFAENFTVTKYKIPLFRIVPWIYDRIDEWKKIATLNALKISSSWKNHFGKLINWSLEKYRLGDYTVNGATFEVFRSAWGTSTKWIIEKTTSLATKAGLGGAFKYASISATRTATRLLLQIGGKSLAKLGTKAITALISAATTIGSIFSVILSGLMVLDLIKMGFRFIKDFFTNGEFRKIILGWSATIGAIFTTLNLGYIGLIFGTIIAWTLQTLMFSLLFIGIMVASITLIYRGFGDTLDIDSGTSDFIASIICDDTGGTTLPGTTSQNNQSSTPSNISSNASKASCLAKYLNQCYGQSVNVNNISKGLACLASYAISPAAIDEINRSATGYTNLQCVGFVKAVTAWAGVSIGNHNACGYVEDPKFVSGLNGVKPGDAIVFRSSGTCSDGAPGHIGILKEKAGANICLIDANYKCPGCVVDGNCLPITDVAGYLRL